MGDVWTAVALLIKFFNNYAGKGGNPNAISKSELKDLLQDQFGVELKGRNNPAVDDYFNTLDTNGDGELDFSEFMQYVASFAVLAKEFPTTEGS